MAILDEIARGGRVNALDVVKARSQGQKDRLDEQSRLQQLQLQSLKMEQWLSDRDNKIRLKNSLEDANFSSPEETREASQIAMGLGEYETAMKMEELALKQVPKKDKKYGKMNPIYSNNELIGYAQKDQDGKLFNFKTLKNIKGKGESLTKVTKPARPSKEQISTATEWAKNSDYFGESGPLNFGFSNDDYKILGRTIASRAQKLIVDAKQLNQSIDDETAMDLAAQEIEIMGDTVWKEDTFGKSLKKDIEFSPGISKVIQDYFGIQGKEGEDSNNNVVETWEDKDYYYRKVNGKTQRSPKNLNKGKVSGR